MNELSIIKNSILKVLVGSRAHGLATDSSDWDYRGVFVISTSEILKLGGNIKNTHWIEADTDSTEWELGHFLHLATKCNPTILETFLAPLAPQSLGWVADNYQKYAIELRALFPYIWNSVDVKNAFLGYGFNQQKKMLDEKEKRPNKFAAAYLRTLYNCYQLLTEGTFSVNLTQTPVYDTVKRFKEGNFSEGEVIDECIRWRKAIEHVFDTTPKKEADLRPVNEFLLRVRQENW